MRLKPPAKKKPAQQHRTARLDADPDPPVIALLRAVLCDRGIGRYSWPIFKQEIHTRAWSEEDFDRFFAEKKQQALDRCAEIVDAWDEREDLEELRGALVPKGRAKRRRTAKAVRHEKGLCDRIQFAAFRGEQRPLDAAAAELESEPGTDDTRDYHQQLRRAWQKWGPDTLAILEQSRLHAEKMRQHRFAAEIARAIDVLRGIRK